MFFRRAKKEPVAAAAPATVLPEVVNATSIIVAADADATTAPCEGLAAGAGSDGADEDVGGVAANDDSVDADDVEESQAFTNFNFSTTDDLEAGATWLGQDHVASAITSALESNVPGINICVTAPPGFGAAGEILKLLKAHAALKPRAADWVYVFNFDDPRRPIALRLPNGGGRRLAEGMLEVLSELCVTVPAALESDEFKARARIIADGHRTSGDAALATLHDKAAGQNVVLLRTPNGFGFAPVHDGKVVKPAVFAQLPHVMRSDIEARIADLQKELVAVLAKSPQNSRAGHREILELRASHAQRAVTAGFEELESGFAGHPETMAYLAKAKASLVRNCDVFMPGANGREGWRPGPVAIAQDRRFQRYLVNDFVSQAAGLAGAPVEVLAAEPSIGGADVNANPHTPEDAAHMVLAPGALHLAIGGSLFVMGSELEHAPQVCRALARAIRLGEVRCPHSVLQPDPLPFEVTVVLLADEACLRRLAENDAEFSSMFKVGVRCAELIERTAASEKAFVGWIAGLVARDQRLPLTAAAVQALVGDSARRAAKKDELSLAEDALTHVLAAAHSGALQAEDKVIDAGHIQHVFAQRASRRPLANGVLTGQL